VLSLSFLFNQPTFLELLEVWPDLSKATFGIWWAGSYRPDALPAVQQQHQTNDSWTMAVCGYIVCILLLLLLAQWITWIKSRKSSSQNCSRFPDKVSLVHCKGSGWCYTHNRFTALFWGPPGWAGARRELLDFMVQERLTDANTPTIRLGATPSGLTSAHLHHPPFFTGRMPFLPPNQQCESTEGTKWVMLKDVFTWNCPEIGIWKFTDGLYSFRLLKVRSLVEWVS